MSGKFIERLQKNHRTGENELIVEHEGAEMVWTDSALYIRCGERTWDSLGEIDDIDVVGKLLGVNYLGVHYDRGLINNPLILKILDKVVLEGSDSLRKSILRKHSSELKEETLLREVEYEEDEDIGKYAVEELVKRGHDLIDLSVMMRGEEMADHYRKILGKNIFDQPVDLT